MVREQGVGRHDSSGSMRCVVWMCGVLYLMSCVLHIYEATVGKDHPSYAVIISNMALVYKKKGEYDRALEMYEEARVVYEVR